MTKPFFQARSIAKDFSGVPALCGVDLALCPGEVLGIIGENGAGKSTLIKIISGIYQPSSGELRLDDAPILIKSPIAAKRLGISVVPQEFNLIGSLAVFENVFLGSERRRGVFLDKASMREKTRRLLADLGSSVSPDAPVDALSVAQKQMVEIAKAMVHDSRLLILDEPTTVLTREETAVLFGRMRALKDRGVAMVYISHKLAEVREICDRVLVLRDGEMISEDAICDLDEREMARRMVGRELTQIFPAKAPPSDAPALEVSGLCAPGAVTDASFTLRKGEVLGLAGLMGSGQTELAEALMGLFPKSAGEIRVNGTARRITQPRDAVDLGLAYLSDDRQGKGLVLGFDIPQNVTLISLKDYCRGLIDKNKEREKAATYVETFNIKTASLDIELLRLSGGNQQKVYLSKWMDVKPEILILNEPTRGIDVNAKTEIYRFVNSLARSGIACLVISSELEELIGLCTRVLVMREGRITGEATGADINEETIMYLAAGLGRDTAKGSAAQ